MVSSIRNILGYTHPIYVVTTQRLMLKGLENVEQVHPGNDSNDTTYSRWASRSFKWRLGTVPSRFTHFLYIDLDTLVFSPRFIQEYLESRKGLGLMLSAKRSGFSHSLLPTEYLSQDMFDTCIIIGKIELLDKLFSEAVHVYQEHPGIFNKYGDMPIINRAIINLSLTRESIHQISGVSHAHLTEDYSQSLYHFNSGNLFTKVTRMIFFTLRFRIHDLMIKTKAVARNIFPSRRR